MVRPLLFVPHMRTLLVLLGVSVGVGCMPQAQTVRRSVRAPHAAVPLHDGQPLDGPVAFALGASHAADLVAPQLGEDPNAAVELPEHQVRGELRLRLGTLGEAALIHDRGVGTTAPLHPTQLALGPGAPAGSGVALRYAARVNPELVIGLNAELMYWLLPYAEQRGGATEQLERSLLTMALGITPSWRRGDVTLFGGAHVLQHPRADDRRIDLPFDENDDDDLDTDFNLLLHGGASLRLGRSLAAVVTLSQNVSKTPVAYGPSLGFGLQATFGAKP